MMKTHTNSQDTYVYLKNYEFLHIPRLGYNGLIGYSPIAMAKNAVSMMIAREEYGGALKCVFYVYC